MKKITLSLLIIVLVLIYSCDPNDTPIKVYKFVKIENFNSNNVLNYTGTFEYNNDSFISKLIITSSQGTDITNYIYTNGKLTAVNYNDGFSTNLIYTGNLITSSLEIDANGVETGSGITYTYNSIEQVISIVEFGPGLPNTTTTSTYDSNNNVISKGSTAYTYDSKKNPYLLVFPIELQKMMSLGQNNLLSESNGTTYTYEYNTNGYPTKQTVYFNGQLASYTLYTYAEI